MKPRYSILVLSVLLSFLSYGAAIADGVSVVGDTTREVTLNPGDKVEGRLVLRNSDSQPRDVRVYATDYMSYADGRDLFSEPAGEASRSNASWITFTPHQLTVPANDTASVYYTIQAPQDDKLSGSFWSLLMVEPLSPDALAPPSAGPGKVSMGLKTVIRYAVQILTNVGDTGKRDLSFSGLQLLAAGPKRILQLDLNNTGERALHPGVWVELFDEKGMSLGRFSTDRRRLYPGCSIRLHIDLSQAPKGSYTAMIVADNGDESVFGTRCKLQIQ